MQPRQFPANCVLDLAGLIPNKFEPPNGGRITLAFELRPLSLKASKVTFVEGDRMALAATRT